MFDKEIAELVGGVDTVLKNRIDQLDKVIDEKLDRFQEMLNGVKITVNLEMPVVERAKQAN